MGLDSAWNLDPYVVANLGFALPTQHAVEMEVDCNSQYVVHLVVAGFP